MIVEALQTFERFLLPNSCVVCSRLVEDAVPDSLVCGPCRSRLRPLPPGCERCQQPMPPVGPCRFCAEWPDGFGSAMSAVWLDEEAREIVHFLKYKGFTKLAELVAYTVARHIARPPQNAVLVPIPLGPRRRLERGYNQAAEIARALGNRWSMQAEEGIIRRRLETKTQTALTPEERAKNIRGVFKAVRPARFNEGGAFAVVPTSGSSAGDEAVVAPSLVAILVDDVLTTGATLASAAAALLDAGWEEVRAVTFARALPFAVRVEMRK